MALPIDHWRRDLGLDVAVLHGGPHLGLVGWPQSAGIVYPFIHGDPVKTPDRRKKVKEDDDDLKAQILDTIERLNLLVARLEQTIDRDTANGR